MRNALLFMLRESLYSTNCSCLWHLAAWTRRFNDKTGYKFW